MTSTQEIPSLPWTGERMVPHKCDSATEMYHWQRYLFFRPWYEDAKVIDAASGEGYGTGYAATFAKAAIGYDICHDAVDHASRRYPHAKFELADVCDVDYSRADIVLSFETIEHLPDPIKFIRALSRCKGRIVISTPNRNTHSPGNGPGDKPLNGFHSVEWTPAEFSELVQREFPGRQVRFLSQQMSWPGLVKEGFDENAMYIIAVIGDGDMPKWPKLGLAIPTHNNWKELSETIQTFSLTYPGEIRFAVTANGCDDQTLSAMRTQAQALPNLLHVIVEEENRGYAVGANLALGFLEREGGCDYFGVVNDDVIATTDCLSVMVTAMRELEGIGLNPGVIGPVSNAVAGGQQVNLGAFQDYPSLMRQAELYHREHHSAISQVLQVRGLFMLIHPNCLSDVGGFDPVFGLGNFEDDDHNLRCVLSDYTLWVANGAVLFHHGSSTFRKLGIDYEASIAHNCEVMVRKWGLRRIEEWVSLRKKPANVDIHVALDAPSPTPDRYRAKINGQTVDLLREATETEFAGWVLHQIKAKAPEVRKAVVDALLRATVP